MKKQKKSCKKVIRKSYAQLVKENLGLVYYRVNERWRKTAIQNGIDPEDLAMAGMIGLYYGVRTYSKRKNKSFSGYITWCIEGYIKSEFKKLTRHKTVSLSKVVYENDNGEVITMEDIIAHENGKEEIENKILFKQALNYLNNGEFSAFESRIFQMHYGIGIWEKEKPLSLSEIKKHLNLKISKEALRRKINKVLNRLKTLLNVNGYHRNRRKKH